MGSCPWVAGHVPRPWHGAFDVKAKEGVVCRWNGCNICGVCACEAVRGNNQDLQGHTLLTPCQVTLDLGSATAIRAQAFLQKITAGRSVSICLYIGATVAGSCNKWKHEVN